nr:reverse transcriptase domain-containing protein [Tanacetum cinerariifolium]
MRTRNSYYPNNSSVPIPRRQNKRRAPNEFEPEICTIIEVAPMVDNRTMEELLQAPKEGNGEAIVIPEINADHFEIKTNLLQLVQANPYHGFERENPHTHINNFKRITSTLKFKDVPNDVIKLMMFPYSLEGATRAWYDKEPPNSILTWDDLVNKFVNQFFPPSKTTHLKNEVSRFTQKFKETFGEAWERFKKMLRACPHHGFTELTQIDTFYNGLNENDQDSLNAVAGGNLLSKTTREGLNIIENKSKVRYSRNKPNVSMMNTAPRENYSKMDDRIDKLTDQISTLVDIVSKKVVTLATGKAVEKFFVTCGGDHAYYNCDATNSNQTSVYAATSTYNQVIPQNRASNHMAPPCFCFQVPNNHAPNFQNQVFQYQPFQAPNNQVQQGLPNEFSSYKKSNESMRRNLQIQINELKGSFSKQEENLRKNLNDDMRSILGSFFQNQSSTSGTLSSNTILNPKGEMKAITTRSGVAYEGPSIPTNPSPKKIVEREIKEIRIRSKPISKELCKKATNQMEKFFQIFQDLHFDISFADALLLMPKFASMIKSLLANKDKLFELAKIPLNENCSAMLLKKLIENLGDPGKFLIPCDFSRMDKLSLPELTPTWMTLELADRSITRPKGVAEDVFVKVRKFQFPTDFVVVDFEADPRVPLILGRSFLRTSHALTDIYGEEITLREYAQEVLGFSKNSSGGNPTSTSEPIISNTSPSLTPFEGSDFILEEIEAYLKDDSVSPEIDHANCGQEGDICLIEKLLNNDPFQLPLMDLNQEEVAKAKSSIEEPPKLELKYLPSHLEYAYLEGIDKLPVIIAKGLKDDEKEALLKEDYKPAVQSQRQVNPKILEVIKKEVIKLLDAGMIYPISDSLWVGPVHYVPKKCGITIVENENNELIPTRLVMRWRVCIDYRKLNEATRKDHFPLSFMDQIKQDAKSRLLRWVLLLQEFDIIIRDKKGTENLAADHLSRLENPHKDVFENKDINKNFPLVTFGKISSGSTPWTLNITFGTIPTFFGFVRIKSFDGVCMAKKLMISPKLVMKDPPGAIMVPISPLRKAIISDHGTYFCNDKFAKVMPKYGFTHRLATSYHLQTSGQVEVSNRGLKRILERMVGENRALWSEKLEDALWDFRTACKTPIGCTPYKLIYGKSCHLPIDLEHKAYWALKHANFDLKMAGVHRKLQLNELNELRDQAYENYSIYKEKTKKLHDSKIKNRIFNVGDRVLRFNSRLKIFLGKHKTRWSGPFTINQVFPYGTIELSQPDGSNFKSLRVYGANEIVPFMS